MNLNHDHCALLLAIKDAQIEILCTHLETIADQIKDNYPNGSKAIVEIAAKYRNKLKETTPS